MKYLTDVNPAAVRLQLWLLVMVTGAGAVTAVVFIAVAAVRRVQSNSTELFSNAG